MDRYFEQIFVISEGNEKILDFVKFCKNYTILWDATTKTAPTSFL